VGLAGAAIVEIKAEDIQQYLDGRDDFALELFAYRSLRERGWSASLGGSYFDPILGKLRQFDVRAHRQFHLERHIHLAVECKSLSPASPPAHRRQNLGSSGATIGSGLMGP
jgi:hypothetical protein